MSIIREGMVVTCWRTEARERERGGEGLNRSRIAAASPWRQTWPQNQHANSPNNYSDCPSRPRLLRSLSWFRATARCVVYRIQRYPCTMYECIYERAPRLGYVLRVHRGGSEPVEFKGPQGVLTAGSGRHLTSLNMDYDGRDYPPRSSHEIRTHVGETIIIMHARLTRWNRIRLFWWDI